MGKLKAWCEWTLTPGRVSSCDVCPWREVQEECDKCPYPGELHHANIFAWKAWCILSLHGREGVRGDLQLESIILYVNEFGGNVTDFEKILYIERIFKEKNQSKDK